VKTRTAVVAAAVLLAALSRLLPHPTNFTPIAAIALFGGACFAKRWQAFFVPLAALFLGDLVLGFHILMPVVYGSFALEVCLGLWLRRRRKLLPVASAALAGSVMFFVVWNFGFWALGGSYPMTPVGLLACYIAGIPFFGNELLGDAVYCTVLFGGLALAESAFPRLREPVPIAA
jgi:hypothetical protein